MKRPLSFRVSRATLLVVAGTALVAGTYGLVRLAYGLFLPDVTADLGLSATLAGRTSSGASLAYCVGALLGLGAHRRPRTVVVGALATAAVGSVVMAAAPGVGVFVPAAVLASAGAGLASPGMVALVERAPGLADVGRAQALVNSGTGPGLVAVGVMALVLLPDWRLALALSGVLTAAAGALVLLADRSRSAPTAPSAASEPSGDGTDAPGTAERARLLTRPAVAALLLGAASAVVWTFGRTLVVDAGAGRTASVVAWVLLGAGGAATVLTARRLGALHPARAWTVTVTGVAGAIGLLALAPGVLASAYVAFVVFGWAFVAATSALIAWAGHVLPTRAAWGTSVLFVLLVAGQALGSTVAGGMVGGMVGEWGWRGVFAAAALGAVAAAGCGVRPASARRRDPRPVPACAVVGGG